MNIHMSMCYRHAGCYRERSEVRTKRYKPKVEEDGNLALALGAWLLRITPRSN